MNSSNNKIMSVFVIVAMIASTLLAGVNLVKADLLDPEVMAPGDPTSTIPGLLFPYWNNTGSVEVHWTATDIDDDLANVSLMYNYSSDNSTNWVDWTGWTWDNFTVAAATGDSGTFTFKCPQGGGFYQLRTNATDAATNIEADLTDIVEFAYVTYQPDLMINGTADDVYDMPGGGGGGPPAQYIMESVNRSDYRSYDITVQNDGPDADNITLLFMLDMDPSWDFWVWDLDNSTNMTQYIYGQLPIMGGIDTYLTVSLDPAETRDYSINITVAADAPFGQTGAQILFGISEGAMNMGVYGPDGPAIAMDMVISMLQTYRADYLNITDSPNGTQIANQTINVGDTIQGYASAYSNDPGIGYLGLAKVNWTLVNYSGAAATNDNPVLSTDDVFNANAARGYAYWQAEYVYSYLDMDNELEIYWVNSTIVNITIDGPPTTTFTYGTPYHISGSDLYVGFSTQLNLSAADEESGVASIWYKIWNGTDWSALTMYTGNFTVDDFEGAGHIEFNATDNAGNHEAINNVTIIVDGTAPMSYIWLTGTNYSSAPVYITNETKINLAGTDNGSGCPMTYYRIDGGAWQSGGTTQNFTIASAGAHTIEYRAVDNLGQNSTIESFDVFVDDAAPVTIITNGGPEYISTQLYVNSSTEFNLTATDAGSGVEYIMYRVGGVGTFGLYSGNLTIDSEGTYTIYFYSIDNIGNVEDTKSFDVTVDNTDPVCAMAITTPQAGDFSPTYITSATILNLTATDALSGVGGLFYRIDSGAWITATGNFTVTSAGSHTLEWYAIDNIGQSSPIGSWNIFVDNTAPITSASPAGTSGALEVDAGDTITLSASDADVGGEVIWYSTDDGATWTEYTAPIQIDADTTLLFYSVDALGNKAAEETLAITITVAEEETEEPAETDFISEYWWVLLIAAIVAFLVIILFTRRKKEEGPEEEKTLDEHENALEEADTETADSSPPAVEDSASDAPSDEAKAVGDEKTD